MALLDISLVTQTLINLIQFRFMASPTWNPTGTNNTPPVSPQPPDILKSESVGLYLYHIKEETQNKNISPPGNDNPPVRYIPMGLSLYYQLTAHSNLQTDQATLNEQKMMGIAIKALHDYPVIDDDTDIEDLQGNIHIVFPLGLRDNNNRLRIVLHPIDQHEATSYWTAGSTAMRLAAYYQISVVLLEPEESRSRTGRVLTYDISTFIGGGPRIDGCTNTTSFKIPGKIETNQIELRPAQVPVGEQVVFLGTGFEGGTAELLIKNTKWDKFYPVDDTWGLIFSAKGACMNVQKTITDDNGNPITILPGIYSATIRVKKQITIPGGQLREIEHMSNECPFMISPIIDNAIENIFIVPVTVDKTIIIKGYIFLAEEANEPFYPSLNVYVGNMKLRGIKSTQALTAGDFKVDGSEIKLLIPTGLDPAFTYFPLRIFINGAETSPNWIKVK